MCSKSTGTHAIRSGLHGCWCREKGGVIKCTPRSAPPALTRKTAATLGCEWEFLFMLFPKIKVITSLGRASHQTARRNRTEWRSWRDDSFHYHLLPDKETETQRRWVTGSGSHREAEKAVAEPSSQPGSALYDSRAPPWCPLTGLSGLSSISTDWKRWES